MHKDTSFLVGWEDKIEPVCYVVTLYFMTMVRDGETFLMILMSRAFKWSQDSTSHKQCGLNNMELAKFEILNL